MMSRLEEKLVKQLRPRLNLNKYMTMTNQEKKQRRSHKTRTRIVGKSILPRLSVYRSHKNLSAQIIDDSSGVTLVAADSKEIGKSASRSEQAEKMGELLAKKAMEKKVTQVRFDRGGYKYHGLVKAIAEGARKGGLTF